MVLLAPAFLLKPEDEGRWSVVLRLPNGFEKELLTATPAEHLIAASEVDYREYRKKVQDLWDYHPLFEVGNVTLQKDFKNFVAEVFSLPSTLIGIDPASYYILNDLLERALQQKDAGPPMFLPNVGAQLLEILKLPVRTQVRLRNAMEIAFDGMERATQQERYQKLIGTYPELAPLCNPELLPDESVEGEIYIAYSSYALWGLEFALYFKQDRQRIARCDYCWGYFIPKTKKETHYCDRITDGFPCKARGARFKRNLNAEQDEALLAYNRLRDRMYARMQRYTSAPEFDRQNLISMDYLQYSDWSENARLARNDYLEGKLTSEEFLQKIDVMHDLKDYAVEEAKTPPATTAWQRRVAANIDFDPEQHYPKEMMYLDMSKKNPKWQILSADDLRRRDQEGHQSLRDKYGKNTERNKNAGGHFHLK